MARLIGLETANCGYARRIEWSTFGQEVRGAFVQLEGYQVD